MKRYILTGTPGAGKTTLLRALERLGHDVVEEAATDVNALQMAEGVAQPWMADGFIDAIVELQKERQIEAAGRSSAVQFHDRSPVCTLALCRLLERPVPQSLSEELQRIEAERVFQRQVLFVANLGFVTPSTIRRISLADALRFERLHEEAYAELGYERVIIAKGPVDDRIGAILRAIGEG